MIRKSKTLGQLRARLAEAEETIRAIRAGEVDTVVVAGRQGDQVFTLEGAGHAYRVLIESMNEGALTLMSDKMILYANQRFARMVRSPLERVTGSSFRRFLSAENQATLRHLMRRADPSGSKIQAALLADDGSQMPAQISIRPLAREGSNRTIIGMVVTDLTEAQRTEELLRALTHRVVQVQEAERGHLALELHDHITQLLCAALVHSQVLADRLSARNGAVKREALKVREMLGDAAEEVERISRNLRPGVLEHLGLAAVLRAACTEFAGRTGAEVRLSSAELPARLPIDTEMALFRIFQEALKNVEMHARARHVAVRLRLGNDSVELAVRDDGIGFDPDSCPAGPEGNRGLGLLSMRERAAYVGGVVKIKSVRQAGSEITAHIPLAKGTQGQRNDL